jgi:hypothetical protein
MLAFLGLVNDLNDIQAKFISRLDIGDDDLNPVSLHHRLRALQAKMIELNPQLEELQSSREELLESLLSLKPLDNIASKIPEVSDQANQAKRTLEIAKTTAHGKSTSKTGREAKRYTRIDAEAKLASAMNATTSTESNHSDLIDETTYMSLPDDVLRVVTLSDIQSSLSILLRCGGRLPPTSINTEVRNALVLLGIVYKDDTRNEIRLTSRYGVLL